MSNPKKLFELGQSIWYDNIERRLLDNGELAAMIERGDIYGVTSNPSIFEKAIGNSNDYDEQLSDLTHAGKNKSEIFDALVVQDIQRACDLFAPVFETTEGGDGYVSIEVHPDFANDTEATCKEAERLWGLVDRPNVMVKIPATEAGIPAIERSIAAGININITLIFAQARYAEVIEAYLSGLEQRAAAGQPIDGIASVASFFVSRIDSKVDAWLDETVRADGPQAELAVSLRGRIAIANAKLAYQLFQRRFSDARFAALQKHSARTQRPLWASTSTKNPEYSDVLYVDELIGPDTVNTIPPKTLEAFKDHGTVAQTIDEDVEEARQALENFENVGLSLDQATAELEQEGVEAFSKSIHSLLDTVEERRTKLDG
ncbi:MAG: transaldolase [Chloroflexi bacterium]|nr:transaldolase [Chloroflexota bacterium]